MFNRDAHNNGHLYLAHRPEKLNDLRAETTVQREVFGYDTRLLSAEDVLRNYCDERGTVGAMLESRGVGIHPLKFMFGLMTKARALGAKVHVASPVQGWETHHGLHLLHTPGGTVRTQRVVVCTGGYTGQTLHPLLKNKMMLSNSVVTRPLTEGELTATHFGSHILLTDTRTLRFYYRLLPVKRLQIGSRSAIHGADAQNLKHLQLLTDAIARKFPPLAAMALP